jgi:hypothetical protein
MNKKAKIICLHILIFILFDSLLEDKDSGPINSKNSPTSITVDFFKNGFLICGQNGVIIKYFILLTVEGW